MQNNGKDWPLTLNPIHSADINTLLSVDLDTIWDTKSGVTSIINPNGGKQAPIGQKPIYTHIEDGD